jgi:hypothetical protein
MLAFACVRACLRACCSRLRAPVSLVRLRAARAGRAACALVRLIATLAGVGVGDMRGLLACLIATLERATNARWRATCMRIRAGVRILACKRGTVWEYPFRLARILSGSRTHSGTLTSVSLAHAHQDRTLQAHGQLSLC